MANLDFLANLGLYKDYRKHSYLRLHRVPIYTFYQGVASDDVSTGQT